MARKKTAAVAPPAPPTTARPYQVFVSHATADKWIAKAICEKIEAVGVTTFRDDRDIHGGDDITEEVLRQIRRSREVVVVLTPDSADRHWVLVEVGAALIRRMRIVAIMCHVAVERIPQPIKNKKAYFLNELDRYLVEFEQRARGRHGKA